MDEIPKYKYVPYSYTSVSKIPKQINTWIYEVCSSGIPGDQSQVQGS